MKRVRPRNTKDSFVKKFKYVIIIFKLHMDFFILCSTQENVRQNVHAELLHNIKVNAL